MGKVDFTPVNLVLLGAPGAGKGTQAKMLEKKWRLKHISTGDMLRAEIKAGTSLGVKARVLVEKGEFIPDSIMVDMIADRIAQPDCVRGFILDGFPRTSAQAEALDEMLEQRGLKIDRVILLDAPEKVLLERLGERRDGEGNRRPDDSPKVARRRLEVYQEQTAPILPYYEQTGRLVKVDGARDTASVGSQLDLLMEKA